MASRHVTLVEGENVIILVSGAETALSSAKQLAEDFTQKVGTLGKVTTLQINSASHTESQDTSGYDVCVVGFDFAVPVSEAVLVYALRLLKPSGKLWIMEATADSSDGSPAVHSKDQLQSMLKLNGFVDVEFKSDVQESEIPDKLKEWLNVGSDVKFSCFLAHKPNYEIGASAALKFTTNSTKNLTAAQVWTLSANDLDDDVELLDSDNVLDEDDLRKPDPASLRVTCGDAAIKRKACKNCSCGLAEELEAEKVKKELEGVDPGQKKSSCGSCYLGDAFRCAACPYRGLPAFKPGEKVLLQ